MCDSAGRGCDGQDGRQRWGHREPLPALGEKSRFKTRWKYVGFAFFGGVELWFYFFFPKYAASVSVIITLLYRLGIVC